MTLNPQSRPIHVQPAIAEAVLAGRSGARSHDKWPPIDRVVLDIELPHIAIARALERLDDAEIWRQYDCARDQGSFLDCLATLAGSYSTEQTHFRGRAASTEWWHVLAVLPFLLPSAWPVASPSGEDRGAAGTLYREIQRWIGYDQPVMTLIGTVRYADLCRWSPVTQREYLQVLAREKRSLCIAAEPVPVKLAEGIPQLAFLVCSVQRWNEKPSFPPSSQSSAAEWELRSRLAACLSYGEQRAVRPEHVVSPAPLREGVLAGLRLWLRELARSGIGENWDLQPACKDAFLLRLGSDVIEPCQAVLPVRLHQIGSSAFNTLMQDLYDTSGPCVTSHLNA